MKQCIFLLIVFYTQTSIGASSNTFNFTDEIKVEHHESISKDLSIEIIREFLLYIDEYVEENKENFEKKEKQRAGFSRALTGIEPEPKKMVFISSGTYTIERCIDVIKGKNAICHRQSDLIVSSPENGACLAYGTFFKSCEDGKCKYVNDKDVFLSLCL
jgi:hypothetical protein